MNLKKLMGNRRIVDSVFDNYDNVVEPAQIYIRTSSRRVTEPEWKAFVQYMLSIGVNFNRIINEIGRLVTVYVNMKQARTLLKKYGSDFWIFTDGSLALDYRFGSTDENNLEEQFAESVRKDLSWMKEPYNKKMYADWFEAYEIWKTENNK